MEIRENSDELIKISQVIDIEFSSINDTLPYYDDNYAVTVWELK